MGPAGGYRGTSLATELSVRPGSTLALVSVPSGMVGVGGALGALPPDVSVREQARGKADVVVAFFTRRSALSSRIDSLGKMIFPAGGLWIAWPKRSSGVETDMTDNVIREEALPLGLVDNK